MNATLRRASRANPRVALLAALLCWSGGRAAAEVPEFRQGVWEYESTVGEKKFAAKECIDPTRELRQRDTTLEKIGCKLSSSTQARTYTTIAQCTVKLPSGFASWTTTSILTAESDSAYRFETHEVRNGRTRDEVITAHRVGDCQP
jgi:hypothetical protein